MSRARPRFGWVDALILNVSMVTSVWFSSTDTKVVEATLGLPDTQAQFEAQAKQASAKLPTREAPAVSQFERFRRVLGGIGETMLPGLTLGVAVATFRHRACRSRRALRHVGVLTSAVEGIFVAFLFGGEFAFRWFWPLGLGGGHLPLGFQIFVLSTEIALVTSALWGVLAIGGRWRASPEWPDRLGRVLGWAWIAYAVLGVLLHYAGLVIYRADGTHA